MSAAIELDADDGRICAIRHCSRTARSIWSGEPYCDTHNPFPAQEFARINIDAMLEEFQCTLAERDHAVAHWHGAYQRALHRAERAEEALGREVRAQQTDTEWALVIGCDGRCGVPPLRIKVAPPEDAVPGWIRGMGWRVDGDGHWCPGCKP